MSDYVQRLNRRSVLQYAAVLGAGVVTGGALRGNLSLSRIAGAATPGATDATATRQAELTELSELRTQVADPPVCTPAPTETPAPPTPTPTTVPPAQSGVPLPFLDIWTVTVFGIAPTPGGTDTSQVGQLMRVDMSIAHASRRSEFFPFESFVLVDSAGRFSVIHQEINQSVLGNGWAFSIEPGVTENRAMIFDVAADAGESFILESDADPTFRVALTVEQRG